MMKSTYGSPLYGCLNIDNYSAGSMHTQTDLSLRVLLPLTVPSARSGNQLETVLYNAIYTENSMNA